MGLIEDLEREHQVILEFLDCFEAMLLKYSDAPSFPSQEFRRALDFIETYVDQLHHGKEEKALFPVAFEAKLVQGGGPKCSFFFEMFLEHRFLERIKGEVKPSDEIPPYIPKNSVADIIKAKDPLTIPLEDHQAGYFAVRIMAHDLMQGGGERFFRIGRWYAQMLRHHIGKEDQCLFVRLRQTFKEEQFSKINSYRDDKETFLTDKAMALLEQLKTFLGSPQK